MHGFPSLDEHVEAAPGLRHEGDADRQVIRPGARITRGEHDADGEPQV
jgi:hypothetical protein